MQSQDIVDRLKNLLKIKTDKELAEKLGVNYNTLKTQIGRDSLDLVKIIDFAKKEGLELDYIFQNETINIETHGDGADATFLDLSQGKRANTTPSAPVAQVPEHFLRLLESLYQKAKKKEKEDELESLLWEIGAKL